MNETDLRILRMVKDGQIKLSWDRLGPCFEPQEPHPDLITLEFSGHVAIQWTEPYSISLTPLGESELEKRI